MATRIQPVKARPKAPPTPVKPPTTNKVPGGTVTVGPTRAIPPPKVAPAKPAFNAGAYGASMPKAWQEAFKASSGRFKSSMDVDEFIGRQQSGKAYKALTSAQERAAVNALRKKFANE